MDNAYTVGIMQTPAAIGCSQKARIVRTKSTAHNVRMKNNFLHYMRGARDQKIDAMLEVVIKICVIQMTATRESFRGDGRTAGVNFWILFS